MAKTILSITLVILFWGLTLATRTKLLPLRSRNAVAAVAPGITDGICSLMVKTQGYTCEEHLVLCLHLFLF